MLWNVEGQFLLSNKLNFILYILSSICGYENALLFLEKLCLKVPSD